MDFLNSIASIALCRLNKYLRINSCNILSDIAERFESLDISEFLEFADDDYNTMSESKKRYLHVLELFNNDYKSLVQEILDFSIMLAYRPDAAYALKQNNIRITIYEILKINKSDIFDYGYMMSFLNKFKNIFCINDRSPSFMNTEISADSRLIAYLAGNDSYNETVNNVCCNFTGDIPLHSLIINSSAAEYINDIIDNKKSVIHIKGNKYSGKKFLLKHSARSKNKEIIFVDFQLLMRYDAENISETLWQIKREALFYNRIVCWHNVFSSSISENKWEISEFLRLCVYDYIENDVQICICSDNNLNFSSECIYYPVNTVNIEDITEHQRIEAWKYFCDFYSLHSLPYMDFALRYKLSIGKISEIFKKKSECLFDKNLSDKQIFDKLCSETWCTDKALLKLKISGYTFDDLKLPEAQINTFRQICRNFENSYMVYNEWNMKRKFPYGRGISILLTGPPGTGKTMSACVIANEIKLPLYQADMSQVFDKYIGETEKNIDAIFNEAEKQNCVLFLDEADSLCGKRSEINDSKDKYSNNDTAFILQRIENYDGIVILATNYINNIDTAFMRRMKYVIPFSIPDKKIRYEIWKSSFTSEIAIDSDVDFEYLAEQFEFSGSNIKNIVLAAVFLSASEKTPVNMKHILASIYNECLKQQRHMFSVEFGKYEDLFNEITMY